MKKRLTDILIVILLIVLAVSGYNLWKGLSEYKKGEEEYSATAESYLQSAPQAQEDEAEKYGLVCPISVDFDGLKKENEDIVGWIYCEGTPINYPVVRGATNDTYLHTTVSGQSNSAGSIFMDYRCAPNLSGFNTIIYGHHMKNGSMFASLHDYGSQEFYDEHPLMWYLTPERVYRLDLLAGYVGEADAEVYEIFADWPQLTRYLEFASSRSTFKPEGYISTVPLAEISGVIVLSTCSYEYSDARYVVVGVPILAEPARTSDASAAVTD